MLAARSATRTNLARRFSTISEAAGVKVASVDDASRTAAVTLLVKAGSRFESKRGAAHVLKNFAFKATGKRSALGTVRESELYGGVLSSSHSREHLAVTAEFLRGDEAFFVDLLTSFLTASKFTRHELQEYVGPVTESESTFAVTDPATQALEQAHAIAFRNGLGTPLFAPTHNHVTHEDVKAYAQEAFAKGNIAFLGSGISQEKLTELVNKGLANAASSSASSSSTSPASQYHGGETRINSTEGKDTVFIGFGSAGAPIPALSALAAHLDTTPSVKWSTGLSPVTSSLPTGTTVKAVYLPYSDAALFGYLIQGSPENIKEVGKKVVQAVKDAGKINEEEAKKAANKAKFTLASALDTRAGLVEYLGAKVLGGKDASIQNALSGLDSVNASAVAKAAQDVLKGKPTYVAVGDITRLPYADELGI